MLSYKIFDIYLPRNKRCDVFLTRWQSRRRGLIFKAKMTKDTNRDEVYLTSNPESTKSKLHYTLNCMSQQNGDLCRERMFFERVVVMRVSPLTLYSYSTYFVWCNHFLPPNSLLSLKSCVIGAMHVIQGFSVIMFCIY